MALSPKQILSVKQSGFLVRNPSWSPKQITIPLFLMDLFEVRYLTMSVPSNKLRGCSLPHPWLAPVPKQLIPAWQVGSLSPLLQPQAVRRESDKPWGSFFQCPLLVENWAQAKS